jgi:CDP-diglyceride synthetase
MFRNYYLTNYSSHGGSSSDWPQRITTICVGVPILWVLFSYAGTRQSFFQGTHAIMCWEWIQLTVGSAGYYQNQSCGPGGAITVGGGMGFMIVSILLVNVRDPSLFQAAWIAVLALSYLYDTAAGGGSEVSSSHQRSTPPPSLSSSSSSISAVWTGLVLITVPCRAWLMLQENFHHTVSLLLVVWNGDTAALLAGRVWRRITCVLYRGYNPHSPVQDWLLEPPWLRRISPSKSVVGCVCGVLGATWTFCVLPAFWAWVHRHDLAPPSSVDDLRVPLLFPVRSTTPSSWDASSQRTSGAYTHPVVIGASLGLAGILGDLWESAVKRTLKAKDAGRLLPGHGGVLDRFDSTLVAVLLYHYYVEQGII